MDTTGKNSPPWTDQEVYLISGNLYCDAAPFAAFSSEWKWTKTGSGKGKKDRWDKRPCVLFYVRSLLALYLMTGKVYRDNEDLVNMIGNIAAKSGNKFSLL